MSGSTDAGDGVLVHHRLVAVAAPSRCRGRTRRRARRRRATRRCDGRAGWRRAGSGVECVPGVGIVVVEHGERDRARAAPADGRRSRLASRVPPVCQPGADVGDAAGAVSAHPRSRNSSRSASPRVGGDASSRSPTPASRRARRRGAGRGASRARRRVSRSRTLRNPPPARAPIERVEPVDRRRHRELARRACPACSR